MIFESLVICAALTFLVFFVYSGCFTVDEGNTRIILRFGRFLRICNPGLNWAYPFIDTYLTRQWHAATRDGKRPVKYNYTSFPLHRVRHDPPEQTLYCSTHQPFVININYYSVISNISDAVRCDDLWLNLETAVQNALRFIVQDTEADSQLIERALIDNVLCYRDVESFCNLYKIRIEDFQVESVREPEAILNNRRDTAQKINFAKMQIEETKAQQEKAEMEFKVTVRKREQEEEIRIKQLQSEQTRRIVEMKHKESLLDEQAKLKAKELEIEFLNAQAGAKSAQVEVDQKSRSLIADYAPLHQQLSGLSASEQVSVLQAYYYANAIIKNKSIQTVNFYGINPLNWFQMGPQQSQQPLLVKEKQNM